MAKPFLKWAGGKRGLLATLSEKFPKRLLDGEITRYVEPFLGSGAMFFHVKETFPSIKTFVLSDINRDLVDVYRIVQSDPDALVDYLRRLAEGYFAERIPRRAAYFNAIRLEFNNEKNRQKHATVDRAAKFIFLNKTCFNGLYRENSRGEFNVPHGSGSVNRIVDDHALHAAHQVLKGVKLYDGRFEELETRITSRTFVYLDPPYVPHSRTSAFTKYSNGDFSDADHLKLANLMQRISQRGARIMLSNSSPVDQNERDGLVRLYFERGMTVRTVSARRAIASKSKSRGMVEEIVVTNY